MTPRVNHPFAPQIRLFLSLDLTPQSRNRPPLRATSQSGEVPTMSHPQKPVPEKQHARNGRMSKGDSSHPSRHSRGADRLSSTPAVPIQELCWYSMLLQRNALEFERPRAIYPGQSCLTRSTLAVDRFGVYSRLARGRWLLANHPSERGSTTI